MIGDGYRSLLSRVAAAKVLRHQVRQDNSGKSALASLPGIAIMTAGGPVMVPVGMFANELANNALINGKEEDALSKLDKAEQGIRDRSWKEQALDGMKKSPLWALGGAVGGGLGGYALSKGGLHPTIASALGGGVAGAAAPVIMSLISKAVLNNVSNNAVDDAKKNVAGNPVTTSIPFIGDALVAAGIPANALDRKIAN